MSRDVHPDPRSLMRRAKEGDREAFGTLYERYFTPVFRYVYFRVRHHEDAKNLVQEVFMKIYDSLPSFREGAAEPLAYFFTVARNTVIDYWRKKRDVSLDEDDERIRNIPDERATPHEAILKKDVANLVRNAIQELNPEQQEIITLKFLNDVSTKEIAAMLGKSEEAVRQLQCRALKRLRTRLHPHTL